MKRPRQHLFALCALVLVPFLAHAKVFGLMELRSAVSSDDEAVQRSVAYSDVPSHASASTLDLYFGAMMVAAYRMSDMGRVDALTTLWGDANTGSPRPQELRLTWLAAGTGTQLEEAAVLGQAQVARSDGQDADTRVLARSDLANLYLSVGEYAKAEALLSQAETIVVNDLPKNGLPGKSALATASTKAKYLKTRCTQQKTLYQFKKAEVFCLQAIEAQAEAIRYQSWGNPSTEAYAGVSQVGNYASLAQVYIQMNRYFDAELAIRKARELFANPKVPRHAEVVIAKSSLLLAMARREPPAVLKNYESFAKKFNLSEASAVYVDARKLQQTMLVGAGQWEAAQKAFDQGDAIIADSDVYIRQAARNIIPRSLTYLNNQRASLALPLLQQELGKSETVMGPEHAQTGLLRGLHAMALVAADPSQQTRGLEALDRAVTTMTGGGSLAEDYFNQPDRAMARRMVFEKYIELSGESAGGRYSGRALGIADSLRNSGVQQAMNDAAVRAAASTPQLADLVRRDQDAKNELAGLYEFLANRADSLEANRLASVVGQMKARVAELEKARALLDTQLSAQFSGYKKLTSPAPPTLAEIAARLKPYEALLALLPTDRQVYVWAVSVDAGGNIRQQFSRAALDKAQLAGLVKRLRASLDVAGMAAGQRPVFDHAAAQTLYQALLAPVASAFEGKSSVVVAAGGVLGQIPFGVLQTQPGNSSTGLGDAAWLIKQAAVTHVPSVAAWLTMRALPHRAADEALMAWGDPLFNLAAAGAGATAPATQVRHVVLTRASTSVDLQNEAPRSALRYAGIPPLPETRDELLAIARTLGADTGRDLLLGPQATRASVLAASKSGALGKRRVIAFATHGLMAGDLPNLTQPALAMTGTQDADTNVLAPLLTLEDVLGLKLNADWVVLSACNTAAADGKAEEALSGLARGFFYAGSRSLLVTHWAVDSDSAVTLTTETFRHYQGNPSAPKAESLRQAMLKVLGNPATAHPTYWAPYALVGDGDR